MTTSEPLFAPRIAEGHYNLVRVRYDGSAVTIRHQVRSRETRTCLRAVCEVSESTVGENAAVGNYSNLRPEAKELFGAVVEGNASGVRHPPADYPLRGYDYVRYRGDHYSLDELRGSTTAYHYRVRNGTDASSDDG